jgi:antirestriction protein ArdC
MGAYYLKSYCGIDTNHFENNVAYIQNWLQKLKNDERFIILASAKAQRAVDYILKVVPVEKEVEEV